MTSNRRRHPRVRTSGLDGHLRLPDGQRVSVVVENVSLGGVFVRSARLVPVETRLAVDLSLPGGLETLSIEARVATCLEGKGRVSGMGLQFLLVSQAARERLGHLVTDLAQRDSGPASLPSAGAPPATAAGTGLAGALPFDTARLMTQVKGLLMELFEAQRQLAERNGEVQALREEVRGLRRRLGEP